jgi:hypothetical protein
VDEWLVSVNVDGDGLCGTLDFGNAECPEWLQRDIRRLQAEEGESAAWRCKTQIVKFEPELVAGKRNQRTTLVCVETISCRTGRIQKARPAKTEEAA